MAAVARREAAPTPCPGGCDLREVSAAKGLGPRARIYMTKLHIHVALKYN